VVNEEDDNLGVDVSDDMFACVCQLLIFLVSLFTLAFPSLLFPLRSNQPEMMKRKLNHNKFLDTFDARLRQSCCENYVDATKEDEKILLLVSVESCMRIDNVTFT
jgi:hypothetical protein